MKKLILLFAAIAALASCGSKGDYEVQYLPFQSEQDGRWGLVGTDGKVLFKDEFKQKPTVATNGRFFVKNDKGMWEMYTAEEKPKKVGREYTSVTVFSASVTPVVEKGMKIELIDKDGNIVKVLDNAGGKPVTSCQPFYGGVAVVQVSDTANGGATSFGCVNEKGDVVVAPRYSTINPCSDGKMLALDEKYAGKGKGEQVLSVLDVTGAEIGKLRCGKFEATNTMFHHGSLAVSEEADGQFGLVDAKGEWIVRPSKKTQKIAEDHPDGYIIPNSYSTGENYIYSDGENYGVKSYKGEDVIRAKYKELKFVSDEILAAKDDADSDWKLVNIGDETLGEDTYKEVTYYFDGSHMAVKVSDKEWVFVDGEGKEQGGTADIFNIELSLGDALLNNDDAALNEAVAASLVDKEAVRDAYLAKLEQAGEGEDLFTTVSYCLADITGDGIPELWINVFPSEADSKMYVYVFEDGQLRLLGDGGSGHSAFYINGSVVTQQHANQGYAEWYEWKYDKASKTIKESGKPIYEEDVSKCLSEKTDYENTSDCYTTPPGKYMEFVEASNTQPIYDAFGQ